MVRARTITSIAAVAGAAAIGYASVIERNWFALRQADDPGAAAGRRPAAGAAHIRHAPDARTAPADGVRQVAGRRSDPTWW